MSAPNMATITASLERSLQNFSLNHQNHSSSSSSNRSGGIDEPRYAGDKSSGSDSMENLDQPSDSFVELHSETPLPHSWEQCLDLKTGEVYYINWRTGMKSQEDPRTNPEITAECYSEDGSSSYDSEGSSSESSPSVVSREDQWRQYSSSRENNEKRGGGGGVGGQVLVVAGCKSCLMYFMVPKQVEDCPKCFGQLLHFDRTEDASP